MAYISIISGSLSVLESAQTIALPAKVTILGCFRENQKIFLKR